MVGVGEHQKLRIENLTLFLVLPFRFFRGSMNSLQDSPKDPVFFTHHAYIDRIYGEFQARGGGNTFAGEHEGNQVSQATVMQPFGRAAGDILSGISTCTSYVGGGGGVSRQAVVSSNITVQALVSGSTSLGGFSSIIPTITKELKKKLQLAVARKKVSNPAGYKVEVAEAVEKKESCKTAAEQFGMSPRNVEAYVRTQALIFLTKGVDISEPEVVEETAAAVEQEGFNEVAALVSGQELQMKVAKISEAIATTVITLG